MTSPKTPLLTPREIEQLLPEALAPEPPPAGLVEAILHRTSQRGPRRARWWAMRLAPLAMAAVLAMAAMLTLRVPTDRVSSPTLSDLAAQLVASLDAAGEAASVDGELAALELELAQLDPDAGAISSSLWLDVESQTRDLF